MDPDGFTEEEIEIIDAEVKKLFPPWMSTHEIRYAEGTPKGKQGSPKMASPKGQSKRHDPPLRRASGRKDRGPYTATTGVPKGSPAGYPVSVSNVPLRPLGPSLRVALIGSVGMVIAFVLGAAFFSESHTSTAVAAPAPAVTVTRAAIPMPAVTKTVTITAVPKSCRDAMSDLRNMEAYANTIIDSRQHAIDDLQAAYVAVATHDIKSINAAQTRLYNLERQMTDPDQNYEAMQLRMSHEVDACLGAK